MFSMLPVLPADWPGGSFGGCLSFIFLWLISMPPVGGHADESITE
jgi:hypothetical protein